MSIPRVIVVTKNSFLNLALPKLIDASGEKFDVVESNANGLDELAEEITASKSNVVLLEQNDLVTEGDIFEKILSVHPNLLVIITNQEDNWLRTYRRQDVLISSSADLIEVIASARRTHPYKNKTKEKEKESV